MRSSPDASRLPRPALSRLRAPVLERGEGIGDLVDDLHARQAFAQPPRHFAARPERHRGWELAAQRRERVADLAQRERHRERQRDDVDLVGERRLPDILERRLGS